ncbi:MAG: hypothetical protein GY822_11530 [Deltaproteobacteria bacterium]|nr:hypothetical protein [Deltaproteobacteria bacterium]
MSITDDRGKEASVLLIALSVLVLTAASAAMCVYSYPETLAEYQPTLMWIHDVTGDLSFLLTGIYLYAHLSRVWRMKKLGVSRYSGILLVGIWGVACVSGVAGQFLVLRNIPWLWNVHFSTSLVSIIVVCFHGAWAYRPRKRSSRPSSSNSAALARSHS